MEEKLNYLCAIVSWTADSNDHWWKKPLCNWPM